MPEIPLGGDFSRARNLVALVDDEDVPLISGFRWHALACAPDIVYAQAHVPGNTRKRVLMHKLILPVDSYVDHRAAIACHPHHFRLGRFANEDDAARAYNEAAARLFGEFARLNVIEGALRDA